MTFAQLTKSIGAQYLQVLKLYRDTKIAKRNGVQTGKQYLMPYILYVDFGW